MRIRLINVAQKLPAWCDAACDDYLRRLPRELAVEVVTVPLAARPARQSADRARKRESAAMLDRIQGGDFNIALDEQGEDWSSGDWSTNLQRWMFEQPRVNLLVGGPEGLSQDCLDACRQRVALGRMTMPHALVKLVLLEQLYRAWTIIKGHPYHRE